MLVLWVPVYLPVSGEATFGDETHAQQSRLPLPDLSEDFQAEAGSEEALHERTQDARTSCEDHDQLLTTQVVQ